MRTYDFLYELNIVYSAKVLNKVLRRVMITKNLDKGAGVVNGQVATIVGHEGCTLLLELPNKQRTFTYPVTTQQDDDTWSTAYALMPAYAMTILKSEGATIDKLLVWMDCSHVPEGLGYVALSRVCALADIAFLTPLIRTQFRPVSL